MANTEYVILVDQHDREIGTEEKLRAHERGVLHRAFSVFILRESKHGWETLLQQRHQDKYHCGGLWTNSCCSHPRMGESTQTAAERRLIEELGLTLPLTHVGEFTYRAEFDNSLIEHEYDHVFIGIDQGQEPILHPNEVSAVKWMQLDTLSQALDKHPELYTPWFKQALDIAKKYLPS